MKNVARASFLAFLPFAATVAILACWPLAPSGGSIDDAALGSGSGGGIVDARTTTDAAVADSGAEDGASPDASDSGDATVPILPYPSVSIAEGIGFACNIVADGGVLCWGSNDFGQAGSTPSAAIVTTPQQVPVVTGATAIALGDYHACAVTSTNAVYCWGLNDSYQLGHTSATSNDIICPGAVAGQTVACNPTPSLVSVPPAVAIAAAGAWTCTVGTDGAVQCWGAIQAVSATGSTACGTGTAAQGGECYPAPYAVSGIAGVAQLAVAFDHACALVPGGAVSCWGNNNEGQVSPQACPQSDCTTPTSDAGLPVSTSVAVGTNFSCYLVTDGGTVSCFGDNTYGELGHVPGTQGDLGTLEVDGGEVFNSTPIGVGGLTGVSELVAAGNQSACALVGGGTVVCWGNVASDAGAGNPVTIAGLPAMNALGVPDNGYACGIAASGSIWCWNLASGAAPTQVP
ncbi:MAG: RCC1 domain-containing protein [Polyangiaceae bacterium]